MLEKIPCYGEFIQRSDPWAGLIASRGSFYPMVLCQLLGIIIRICSKRFLPDKSSINVVERRSVPGGYFSELYIQVKGMLEDRVTRGWAQRLIREYPVNLPTSSFSTICLYLINYYNSIYVWKILLFIILLIIRKRLLYEFPYRKKSWRYFISSR